MQTLTSHLETQLEEADSHQKSKIILLQQEIDKLQESVSILTVEKETSHTELFNEREKSLALQETVSSYSKMFCISEVTRRLYFQVEKWETEAQEKSKLCDDLQNTIRYICVMSSTPEI